RPDEIQSKNEFEALRIVGRPVAADDPLAQGGAGAVDSDPEHSRLDGQVDRLLAVVGVGDVAAEVLAADLASALLCPTLVAVKDDHSGTALGEGSGGCGPEPRRSPGHDRRAVVEFHPLDGTALVGGPPLEAPARRSRRRPDGRGRSDGELVDEVVPAVPAVTLD